jgi:hypothetical protein
MAACWRTPVSRQRTGDSPAQELFFDWNEIRVTTVTELAEGWPEFPCGCRPAGEEITTVDFESTTRLTSGRSKKQNLGKAEKDLERSTARRRFVQCYVTQNALGGHSIPVSRGGSVHARGQGDQRREADKGQVPRPRAGNSEE